MANSPQFNLVERDRFRERPIASSLLPPPFVSTLTLIRRHSNRLGSHGSDTWSPLNRADQLDQKQILASIQRLVVRMKLLSPACFLIPSNSMGLTAGLCPRGSTPSSRIQPRCAIYFVAQWNDKSGRTCRRHFDSLRRLRVSSSRSGCRQSPRPPRCSPLAAAPTRQART